MVRETARAEAGESRREDDEDADRREVQEQCAAEEGGLAGVSRHAAGVAGEAADGRCGAVLVGGLLGLGAGPGAQRGEREREVGAVL